MVRRTLIIHGDWNGMFRFWKLEVNARRDGAAAAADGEDVPIADARPPIFSRGGTEDVFTVLNQDLAAGDLGHYIVHTMKSIVPGRCVMVMHLIFTEPVGWQDIHDMVQKWFCVTFLSMSGYDYPHMSYIERLRSHPDTVEGGMITEVGLGAMSA